MNRRELLSTCGAMSAFGVAGCSALSGDDGRADERLALGEVDDWPMFLYDETNARCFSRDGTAREEPSIRWSYETGDDVWASPVVADGTLYVGSYDGHLYALDADTGELQWRYRTGDRIDGSPAVANGTVYVGSFDRNVYALDAETGEERWIYGTRGIVRSSPTVADGVLYVGAHCRTQECSSYYEVDWPKRGYLYALDADRGVPRWRTRANDGVVSTPAVVGDTAYVGSSDRTLYAVDVSTGERRWSQDTDGVIMSSPTLVDGRVYVGTVDGGLYALDAEGGDVIWRFNMEHSTRVDFPVVITGSPVVCDGTLFVGAIVPEEGTYGKLFAVSAADGTREWATSPYAHAIGSSPVIVDDVLYFGAHTMSPTQNVDPGVYAVAADGTDLWSYTVDGSDYRGFGSSPAVLGETLYIGATDGRVLALDLE